jgi:2-polyprenyl-3-methyl-5-hydroxy-6-metoxy-1,4-benzoquinol methylase
MKQGLWNKEFSEGKWDFIENTSQDIVYRYIEKYCAGGSILDLGCGSGSTGCELSAAAYSNYTGVDISDVALVKANSRAQVADRSQKNRYFQADITAYTPTHSYDVILFRESIYYIPRQRISRLLDHYANFLHPNGVFIIRGHDKNQVAPLLETISAGRTVVEQELPSGAGPVVIVLRPAGAGQRVSFVDNSGQGIP